MTLYGNEHLDEWPILRMAVGEDELNDIADLASGELSESEAWHVARELQSRVNSFEALVAALGRLRKASYAINSRQHAGLKVSPEDWSELYDAENEAKAALKLAGR